MMSDNHNIRISETTFKKLVSYKLELGLRQNQILSFNDALAHLLKKNDQKNTTDRKY